MTGEGFALISQLCLISDYFLFLFPSVKMKVDVMNLWLTFEATSQLHSRTPHLFRDSAPAAVAWPAVLWQKSPQGTLTVDAWSPWPDSWLRHSWRSQITAVFCKLGQKLGKDTTLKRTWCKHIFVSLLAGLSHTFFCLPDLTLAAAAHHVEECFWFSTSACVTKSFLVSCVSMSVISLEQTVSWPCGLSSYIISVGTRRDKVTVCAVYVSVWL